MKTPKHYLINLKERIITVEMLVDCIYSCNKRAKNYRDKKREYKRKYTIGYEYYLTDIKTYNDKINDFYKKKELLLSIVKPCCIHKEFVCYEKIRIYSYEDDYEEHIDDYVYTNSYFDYDTGDEVYFGDLLLKDKPIYNYYYFYDIDHQHNHTFHVPIKFNVKGDELTEIENRNDDLEIIEIDHLVTEGQEIDSLVSCQFVDKVINLINDGNYIYKN